jgi:hypothetical protein
MDPRLRGGDASAGCAGPDACYFALRVGPDACYFALRAGFTAPVTRGGRPVCGVSTRPRAGPAVEFFRRGLA